MEQREYLVRNKTIGPISSTSTSNLIDENSATFILNKVQGF